MTDEDRKYREWHRKMLLANRKYHDWTDHNIRHSMWENAVRKLPNPLMERGKTLEAEAVEIYAEERRK